jgi:tetratricopeptide (TPR) repeat protein
MLVAGVVGLAGLGCVGQRPGAAGLGLSDRSVAMTGGPTPGGAPAQELKAKDAALLSYTMAAKLDQEGPAKEKDAILYYEQARQQDPALNDKASRRLAVLYDRADVQEKAWVEFQELLKKKPKDPALLNDVGYSLYNRARWAEAETYLRRAVAADKNFKPAWVNLGLALAQQGKYQEALEASIKAVTPAEAHVNVGFVLVTQGKRAEAIAAYRQALQFEPTLQKAQAALAKLEGPAPQAGPSPATVGQAGYVPAGS